MNGEGNKAKTLAISRERNQSEKTCHYLLSENESQNWINLIPWSFNFTKYYNPETSINFFAEAQNTLVILRYSAITLDDGVGSQVKNGLILSQKKGSSKLLEFLRIVLLPTNKDLEIQ